MIKSEFKIFEDELLRREELALEEKFRILDALYEEAVSLGAFPLKDPLEGLDIDIHVARVVNHVPKAA